MGTALAEGRVEDVKDAATLLLANSNLPGSTQQGGGRPIDLRPQLGLPPVVADELDHTPVRLLSQLSPGSCSSPIRSWYVDAGVRCAAGSKWF